MNSIEILKMGSSAAIILSPELLAHLKTAVGKTLIIVKTERGIELSSPSAEFDAQMVSARQVMARRKRALRVLAE